MTKEERLIELIAEKQDRGEKGRYIPNDPYAKIRPGTPVSNKELADHLLSHGVTVQRWIPASEPPKEYRDKYGDLIPFLVCEEGTEYPFRAMYDGKTWGDGLFAIPVKWWMPMPEPPKEEERWTI